MHRRPNAAVLAALLAALALSAVPSAAAAVRPCPTGTYPFPTALTTTTPWPADAECKPCPPFCNTCTSATYCTSCKRPYYRTDSFACVATCVSGTWASPRFITADVWPFSASCKPCTMADPNCVTCNSKWECTRCDPSYRLDRVNTAACIKNGGGNV
ncbi:hypothetical protein Rsub_02344 [Raphidocelis subcapitata]|uniref:Uncharacterized protein n=1 Tax=Raphidocelis subcapitata TaxID=307507 RepID=A0A2V0NPT2_9CHLO|nr:hypothetical protein Rsub_02344 [Raphidocelis subcapitata]|eukprot:GBF89626.1 hypothetical protein Rsub_02344 [Raphidocelis subcapitata]